MLRMIIADDESAIRETIHNLIDWKSLGIEIVATCKNGLEAYDAIIDEYPDIVLTDIKMPGLSGLDLIRRLHEAGGTVQFIILSGYGEFDYAAEAMKYGVHHYLLKPCNEQKIIDAVKEVAQNCISQSALQHPTVAGSLRTNAMQGIIIESLSSNDISLDELIAPYRELFDFENTPYRLHYVCFLERPLLEEYMRQLDTFRAKNRYALPVWMLYVNLAYILIYPTQTPYTKPFENFIAELSFPSQSVPLQHQSFKCRNLQALLTSLIPKIRRFGTVYYINGLKHFEICNFNALLQQAAAYCKLLRSEQPEIWQQGREKLHDLLSNIVDTEFLTTIIVDLLVKCEGHSNSLLLSQTLSEIAHASDRDQIVQSFFSRLELFFPLQTKSATQRDFIDRLMLYSSEHLEDPHLSLKYIAENHLYMNVDYVSRSFVKQTGKKFSAYLNELRIERAKLLLLNCDREKIYTIAEKVGCGNNPQYFSQWFKKHTGLTPTQYMNQAKNEHTVL